MVQSSNSKEIFVLEKTPIICIIIFLTKPYMGGAERRFINLFTYFSKKIGRYNYDVHLCVIDKKKIIRVQEIKGDKNNIHTFQNQWQLLQFLRHSKTDIIHFSTINQRMYLFYKLISKKKHKVVLSLNSIELSTGHFKSRFQLETFKMLVKKSHWIDCLYPSRTDKLKSVLKKIMKTDSIPIITSPPNSFIDLSKFQPSNSKEKLIVFVARLIRSKNPLLAIKSVKQVEEIIRNSSYKVLICGEGPLKKEVQDLIKKLEIDDIISMTGYIDTSKIFSKSSVFLSLQLLDNYPSQSLMEAIACGNYIIASRVGDTEKIVKPEFGVLVNLDEKEISKAIIDFISNSKKSDFLSQVTYHARVFAEKNFQIESYANHIANIWNQLENL